MDMSTVQTHDLERRAEEVERKGSIVRQQEVVYH